MINTSIFKLLNLERSFFFPRK